MPTTVIPSSLAASRSMAALYGPVVMRNLRLGRDERRGRWNAVRSRIEEIMVYGWSRDICCWSWVESRELRVLGR